jgi:hypothetical protein
LSFWRYSIFKLPRDSLLRRHDLSKSRVLKADTENIFNHRASGIKNADPSE